MMKSKDPWHGAVVTTRGSDRQRMLLSQARGLRYSSSFGPGPDMAARIDRHPGLSGQSLPGDLDDYVERVLVAAAGVYWAERGLLT